MEQHAQLRESATASNTSDPFPSMELVVRELETAPPFSSTIDSIPSIDASDAAVLLRQLESIKEDAPDGTENAASNYGPQTEGEVSTPTAARPDADTDGSDSETHNSKKKRRKDAAGADGQGKARPIKVRKPTHTVRREEKEALLKEMNELETRLEYLKERSGLYSGKVDEKEFSNAILRDAIRDQQLSMATAQSVVSGYLNRDYISPLNVFIRLGTDWDERRQTLLAMKERKIRNAYEYVAARSKFLDPLKPHISDERFENAQGDYCCVRFDTIQFENVKSVKQVFDAFVSYLLSMEISITERLGNITVRDDYDFVDDNTISSYRLLSKESGVEVESNGVMFGKYYESHELSNGNPCGVVTVDSVDEDKLHPYMPHKRVRKDICAAIVLTPHWRKRSKAEGEEGNGTDEDELVVTMSRSGYLQLRKPAFPIEPRVLQEMRENADLWRHVMLKSIHEFLNPHFY